LVHQESTSNDVWILGAGPFQRGTIYTGTEFAGSAIKPEESDSNAKPAVHRLPLANLSRENTFKSPQQFAKQTPPVEPKVVQAAHQEPAPPTTSASPAAAVASNASKPAAQPTASPPPKTPDSPQAAAKKPAAPASPQSTGLSASVDSSNTQTAKSAYLQPAEAATLPQPRFNSPQ
jgi:hypothetical protein